MARQGKVLVALALSLSAVVAVVSLEVRASWLRRDIALLNGSGRFVGISWSPESDAQVVDEAIGSPWQGRRVRRLTWTDRYSGVGYLVDLDPSTGRLIAIQEVAIDDLWALLGNALRVLAAVGAIVSATLVVRILRTRSNLSQSVSVVPLPVRVRSPLVLTTSDTNWGEMTPEEENAVQHLAVEAQRLAKSAKPIEAEELARRVPTTDHLTDFMHEKVVAFVEVARAYGVGDAHRAASILREAEALTAGLRQGGVWHEGDALGQIGDAWMTLGNREEAVRVFVAGVAAIEGARFRDDGSYGALARLARRLEAAGEVQRAGAIRQTLPEALARARGWYE